MRQVYCALLPFGAPQVGTMSRAQSQHMHYACHVAFTLKEWSFSHPEGWHSCEGMAGGLGWKGHSCTPGLHLGYDHHALPAASQHLQRACCWRPLLECCQLLLAACQPQVQAAVLRGPLQQLCLRQWRCMASLGNSVPRRPALCHWSHLLHSRYRHLRAPHMLCCALPQHWRLKCRMPGCHQLPYP